MQTFPVKYDSEFYVCIRTHISLEFACAFSESCTMSVNINTRMPKDFPLGRGVLAVNTTSFGGCSSISSKRRCKERKKYFIIRAWDAVILTFTIFGEGLTMCICSDAYQKTVFLYCVIIQIFDRIDSLRLLSV